MIAVDTSSMVAYLSGETGADVDAVRSAFLSKWAVLPPVAPTELLSDPGVKRLSADLGKVPLLDITAGYWERAGLLRATVISAGYKAGLADTLIAQSCLDYGIPLITRDRDFRHFARLAGLVLFMNE